MLRVGSVCGAGCQIGREVYKGAFITHLSCAPLVTGAGVLFIFPLGISASISVSSGKEYTRRHCAGRGMTFWCLVAGVLDVINTAETAWLCWGSFLCQASAGVEFFPSILSVMFSLLNAILIQLRVGLEWHCWWWARAGLIFLWSCPFCLSTEELFICYFICHIIST